MRIIHRWRLAGWTVIGAGLTVLPGCSAAQPAGAPILRLERSIALPGVRGRIDHLAYDPTRRRLFVAELGNGSVDAVELATGATRRIEGIDKPQGLAYLARQDRLAVASGGDGSLRFYRADTLEPVATLRIGDDADNVRDDPTTGQVIVGYGDGAFAFVDPDRPALVRTIRLPAHPEGFQIDRARGQILVNLPDGHAVAATSLDKSPTVTRWPATHGLNFPLALDEAGGRFAIGYRFPARVALLDAKGGSVRRDNPGCGDSDDLFFDRKRDRLYMICGSGKVAAFGASDLASLGTIETRKGARTGLFVPELDRLFVAARAGFPGAEAAILVLKPSD
jgi:hypothetical protein